MKIKDARSLPPVAQEDLRRKVIKSILGGKKQVEAAELFGVTRQAIVKWLEAYREGGSKAIKAKRQGRPRGGSLLAWQSAQIAKTVIDRCPDQLKLPFYLWTREAVGQLIERWFGIRLSVWTVGRYLARWNFTPQKTVIHAFERNPEAVRLWLEEEYPAIGKEAKKEKAEIYWGYEMGLRSDHATGRSYSRRGQTPVIPGTGARFGCNMISAITNRGKLNFMLFKERFDADLFKKFLSRLIRQSKTKIFAIVDRHPVHRSAKVKKWLGENEAHIRMFFLPSYSPELNPDEMLNQDVTGNAVGRKRAHNLREMITHIRSFLWGRQRCPSIVAKYFEEKTRTVCSTIKCKLFHAPRSNA
jgi:transposase